MPGSLEGAVQGFDFEIILIYPLHLYTQETAIYLNEPVPKAATFSDLVDFIVGTQRVAGRIRVFCPCVMHRGGGPL